MVQRQVLYLGEINDSQRAAGCRPIEVLGHGQEQSRPVAIFPHDRQASVLGCDVVQIQLNGLQVHPPRQWGGCWLACQLWEQLALDEYWSNKLPPSRQGARWLKVLKTRVCYRLLDPGSEWRRHRHWYEQSAMADLLGETFGLVQSDKLYRCLDQWLAHKQGLFSYLRQRWEALFETTFDVLRYDLTRTYFEAEPPQHGKRTFGYSRDKRSDCVQVVIALIVTPEGFPLTDEVMPGNTSDKTTLRAFLDKIEDQYGKAQRLWVMDRGIPTEETLQTMREAKPPVHYLVGTPKGRLTKLEGNFLTKPWEHVREQVEVKLLENQGEVYVLVKSAGRVNKERAMRRRRLKKLWHRLRALQQQKLTRDQLLMKLGTAKKEAGRAYYLLHIQLPEKDQDVTPQTFTFALHKTKLRLVRRREGRYLLRSHLTAESPALMWQHDLQLTEIEQAFKELKGDLSIRPIYHQKDSRIEAHLLVAFIAYCLQVTLKHRLRALAPGLTPRAVLEKLAAIQMVDVHLPTTDGRYLVLPRYTQPNKDQQVLLSQLKLKLPDQPPPRIYSQTAHA